MFRFFVSEKENNYFLLSPELRQHLKVARLQNKAFICIYQSKFYVCHLENNKAVIEKELPLNHEYNNPVALAAAIIKPKRMEWIIQKAAELGVSDFYPLITKHVNFKINNNSQQKIARWNKIATAASEQAFRNVKMQVHLPLEFQQACLLPFKHKFIAHEKNNEQIKPTFSTNSLFLVGPEGGFSDEEIAYAQKNNCQIVNLGKRILRAETASLFLLARINE